jgi:hypothetical protein
MLKNISNGSPTKTAANTCSTIETLRYRKSEENFQRPLAIFKGNQQTQQSTSDRLKIGDFILIKQLGTGKYGSVYLVRYIKINADIDSLALLQPLRLLKRKL